ncbi:MAG: DNA-binding protein, partial [Sulfolobaceae archaeon]
MKRIIFDTAGLLAGLENLFPLIYTTPDVIEEVRDSNSVNLLNLSINSGKIIIQSPSKESVDYVNKTLHQIKESELSQTDISVIALAHELRPSVVF